MLERPENINDAARGDFEPCAAKNPAETDDLSLEPVSGSPDFSVWEGACNDRTNGHGNLWGGPD
jgi:hypothetical protein